RHSSRRATGSRCCPGTRWTPPGSFGGRWPASAWLGTSRPLSGTGGLFGLLSVPFWRPCGPRPGRSPWGDARRRFGNSRRRVGILRRRVGTWRRCEPHRTARTNPPPNPATKPCRTLTGFTASLDPMDSLTGRTAVVAGGTRGASRAIAVELARRGAYVYVTGRSSGETRSEVDRPETIEGTLELIGEAGGHGTAIRVDHLEREQVRELATRIDAERSRVDILVNGLWGGDNYIGWDAPVWEHPLDDALRMIRLSIDAHMITSHHLLGLMIRRPGGLVVDV